MWDHVDLMLFPGYYSEFVTEISWIALLMSPRLIPKMNGIHQHISKCDDIFSYFGTRFRASWPDRFGETLASWSATSVRRPIETLSLFSGAGALDIGFQQAGFHVKSAVEIDTTCIRTLYENAKPGRLFESLDIHATDVKRFSPPPGVRYEFILGSPPCQSFSAAGRRAEGVNGTDEDRGNLFRSYISLLETIRPKAFLFENVAGLTGANGGRAWREMLQAFSGTGYQVAYRVLDAADYGVPQHRERIILVGIRTDLDRHFHFPAPTHGPDSPSARSFYSASEALQGLSVNDVDYSGVGGRYGHLLTDIPPGLNYSFYTARLGHTRPIFAWRSKFSDFLYKADPNTPVRTLKADEGGFTGPFHWESRPFTPEEKKRLQTIPDDILLCGNKGEVNAQIGNAVPCQFARILALAVLTQVFNKRLPFHLPLLDPEATLGFRKRKRQLTDTYQRLAANAHQATSNAFTTSPTVRWRGRIYRRSLSPDFKLVKNRANDAYTIRLSGTKAKWKVSVSTGKVIDAFQVSVMPTITDNWPAGVESVCLSGDQLNPQVFACVWRAFNIELERATGRADLIQINGFYRNAQSVACKLSFGKHQRPDAFWRALARVIERHGVGTTQTTRKLGGEWGIPPSKVRTFTLFLKQLGFEVRNHMTNRQIRKGYLLVPYPFPTLTPNSVQAHKPL